MTACRRESRRLLWGVLLAGIFLLPLPPLAAGTGTPAAPEGAAARLHLVPALRRYPPGQTVALGWLPPPGEADEFEILLEPLSPPGPTLRIAEGPLPAPPGRKLALPNLPLGEVRLLFRVGRQGMGEAIWAASAPFFLGFSPARPPSKAG
ncbi:MAG: hypothetical protein ACP5VN_09555, partial [Acidobacteriota bacterium]